MQSKDRNTLLIVGGAIALLAFSGSAVAAVNKQLPSGDRGLRNNNPGNIRNNSDIFDGEIVSSDPSFKQFQSIAYGYRALFVILNTYLNNGFNTIQKIISRYAPSTENATQAYINDVVSYTGIPATQIIGYSINPTDIVKIVKAISQVENGVPANSTDVSDGYQLWLNG